MALSPLQNPTPSPPTEPSPPPRPIDETGMETGYTGSGGALPPYVPPTPPAPVSSGGGVSAPPAAPIVKSGNSYQYWDANTQTWHYTGMTPQQVQHANETTPEIYRTVDGSIPDTSAGPPNPQTIQELKTKTADSYPNAQILQKPTTIPGYDKPVPDVLPPSFIPAQHIVQPLAKDAQTLSMEAVNQNAASSDALVRQGFNTKIVADQAKYDAANKRLANAGYDFTSGKSTNTTTQMFLDAIRDPKVDSQDLMTIGFSQDVIEQGKQNTVTNASFAEFERSHVKLSDGAYISQSDYDKLTPEYQQIAKTQGIDALNRKVTADNQLAKNDYNRAISDAGQRNLQTPSVEIPFFSVPVSLPGKPIELKTFTVNTQDVGKAVASLFYGRSATPEDATNVGRGITSALSVPFWPSIDSSHPQPFTTLEAISAPSTSLFFMALGRANLPGEAVWAKVPSTGDVAGALSRASAKVGDVGLKILTDESGYVRIGNTAPKETPSETLTRIGRVVDTALEERTLAPDTRVTLEDLSNTTKAQIDLAQTLERNGMSIRQNMALSNEEFAQMPIEYQTAVSRTVAESLAVANPETGVISVPDLTGLSRVQLSSVIAATLAAQPYIPVPQIGRNSLMTPQVVSPGEYLRGLQSVIPNVSSQAQPIMGEGPATIEPDVSTDDIVREAQKIIDNARKQSQQAQQDADLLREITRDIGDRAQSKETVLRELRKLAAKGDADAIALLKKFENMTAEEIAAYLKIHGMPKGLKKLSPTPKPPDDAQLVKEYERKFQGWSYDEVQAYLQLHRETRLLPELARKLGVKPSKAPEPLVSTKELYANSPKARHERAAQEKAAQPSKQTTLSEKTSTQTKVQEQTKTQPKEQTKTQPLTQTQTLTKTLPLTKTEPKTQTLTKTQTQTKTAPLTKTLTQTQTAPQTQPLTKTQIETQVQPKIEIQNITPTQPAIVPPPVVPPPVVPPPVVPPPVVPPPVVPPPGGGNHPPPPKEKGGKPPPFKPLPKDKDAKLRKLIKNTPGVYTFYDGRLGHEGQLKDHWVVIFPPGDQESIHHLLGAEPRGATRLTGPGAAYRTAQKLWGHGANYKPDFRLGFEHVTIYPAEEKGRTGINFSLDKSSPLLQGKVTIMPKSGMPQNKSFPLAERVKMIHQRRLE